MKTFIQNGRFVIESSSNTKQWMTNATFSGGHHSGMILVRAIVPALYLKKCANFGKL